MIATAIRRGTVLVIAAGAMCAVGPRPAQAQAAGNEQPAQYDTAKAAYAGAKPQPSLNKMSTTDKLWAIEQIKQLTLRYARCISQKDWKCVRDLFTLDFYDTNLPHRVYGPDGFMEEIDRAGVHDRVFTVVHTHGEEVEILSPTTARGIVAADFTFYYPLGESFPTTGKEVVKPGQQAHTSTYYYYTFEKINDQWRIKTLDHVSFDLRTDHSAYITTQDCAYVSADGVPPYEHTCPPGH